MTRKVESVSAPLHAVTKEGRRRKKQRKSTCSFFSFSFPPVLGSMYCICTEMFFFLLSYSSTLAQHSTAQHSPPSPARSFGAVYCSVGFHPGLASQLDSTQVARYRLFAPQRVSQVAHRRGHTTHQARKHAHGNIVGREIGA